MYIMISILPYIVNTLCAKKGDRVKGKGRRSGVLVASAKPSRYGETGDERLVERFRSRQAEELVGADAGHDVEGLGVGNTGQVVGDGRGAPVLLAHRAPADPVGFVG